MFRGSLLSFILLSSASAFTQHSQPALAPVHSSGLSFARTAPEFPSRFSSSTTENFFKKTSFTSLGSSTSAESVDTASTTAVEKKTPVTLSTKTAVVIGTVLALTSGYINGACASGFFSPSQFTAAVTGTWTNSAIALATGQNTKFITLAAYLFTFMSGSAIAGLLVPDAKPFEVANAKGLTASFAVGSIALAVAGITAKTGSLPSQVILGLCFIANGIQNSLTSAYTANLCRTTHFSGITSDIGTFLGQALRGNKNNLLKLKVFPLLAFAFWSGSFIAYPLAKTFQSYTLLAASAVYGVFAACSGALAMRK